MDLDNNRDSSAQAVLTKVTEERSTTSHQRNGKGQQSESIDEYIIQGSIRFQHLDSSDMGYRRREFIVVKEDDDRAQTLQFITKRWNLGDPKLVISLVGGYRGIKHITSRVKKIFLRELVNAVLSTGAWLTTGGLHSGMTKDVGEALQDYAIGRAMAEHRSIAVKIDPNDVRSAQLDPNHTHFIVINDNGSGYTKSTAQNKFLKAIAVKRVEGTRTGIPVVCILVGGGHTRIKAVYQTVVENKIPVIILEGSGGAADVLAFAYQHMSTKHSNNDGNLSVETITAFNAMLKSSEFNTEDIKSEYKELIKCCREIADRRSLLTVLSIDESHGVNGGGTVQEHILNALLKAKPGNQNGDQLHLATVLNNIDLAQQLLSKETCLKVTEVRQSLRLALVNDQVDFVQLFLNKGFDLRDYLTERELTSLYRTVRNDTLLFELLADKLEESGRHSIKNVELVDIGHVINELTTWSFKPLYLQDNFTDDNNRFKNPSRELFLWAVLQGRLEMAKLFWREGKEPIGGALVASKFLKEMATQEITLHESRRLTRYDEGKRLFDKLAVDVLSECYQSDRKLTSLTLVRILHTWGSANCLDLANTATNKEFIAHPAVQNMLKEFWMGNLSVSNPRWKVWLCLMFPPALFFTRLKLKEEEVDPLVVKRLPRGRTEGSIRIRRPLLLRTFSIRRSVLSFLPGIPARDETDQSTSGPNFTGLPLREMNQRKRVNVDEQERNQHVLKLPRRIKSFFLMPLVIFLYNVLSRMVFLGLFSYVLLEDFTTRFPTTLEYILLAWFVTLCTEMIRQIFWEDGPTLKQRLGIWTCYFWNIVDICKIVIFVIGYGLRCFPQTMPAGRILLSISLIVFYVRLLHIWSANKHLGPKLIMIQKMFADLFGFICILFVFLVAYGVAREAILYPGRTGVWSVLESILYRPYLQIFGELLEDNADDSECMQYSVNSGNDTHPATMEACRQYAWFGTIMLSVYLFLSNVLLLNLLIAMFNFTFYAVQQKTDIYWKWQKYKLIKEYEKLPALAPPFIIFSHIFLLIVGASKRMRRMCQSCCTCVQCHCQTNRPQTDNTMNEVAIWESVKGEDYVAKEQEKEQQDVFRKLQNNDLRMKELSTQVTKVKLQLQEEMSSIDLQLKNMQLQLENMQTSLKETLVAILGSPGQSREGHS